MVLSLRSRSLVRRLNDTSSTLTQPEILVVTLVANSVVSTIQHEESQLPATIILKQPLLLVKLTTERPSGKVPALFPSSAMTATPSENGH